MTHRETFSNLITIVFSHQRTDVKIKMQFIHPRTSTKMIAPSVVSDISVVRQRIAKLWSQLLMLNRFAILLKTIMRMLNSFVNRWTVMIVQLFRRNVKNENDLLKHFFSIEKNSWLFKDDCKMMYSEFVSLKKSSPSYK